MDEGIREQWRQMQKARHTGTQREKGGRNREMRRKIERKKSKRNVQREKGETETQKE